MQVSSGLPLPAENISSALLSEAVRQAEPWAVEDEEFPSELPSHYDWMLQPASQSNSTSIKQFVVVLLTIVLVAVSVFVAHKMYNPSPSVLASPTSPPR
jgi:hypothetical protein